MASLKELLVLGIAFSYGSVIIILYDTIFYKTRKFKTLKTILLFFIYGFVVIETIEKNNIALNIFVLLFFLLGMLFSKVFIFEILKPNLDKFYQSMEIIVPKIKAMLLEFIYPKILRFKLKRKKPSKKE